MSVFARTAARLRRTRPAPVFSDADLPGEGSADWRDICLPKADGTWYVVGPHRHAPRFRDEYDMLLRQRRVPVIRRLVAVDPATVRRMRAEAAGSAARRLSPGAEMAERVLADAAADRASDVRVIVTGEDCRVRIRIMGSDIELARPFTWLEGMQALEHVFDNRDGCSGHAALVRGRFQSFSVSPGGGLGLPDGVIKLRGQRGSQETLAGPGEHMVLRLFHRDAESGTATLDGLGLDDETLAHLAGARRRLQGGIVIGGVTGDGKSTTLIRAIETLAHEWRGRLAIATIEDPVEYLVDAPGVVQIPVPSAGDGAERHRVYHDALRHFVRINPDVGIISEIRDDATAREALRFIDTGHQVWTTIHVNDANAIPFRMIDLGVAAAEICKPGTIALLMKQTLVPLLCPDCARDAPPQGAVLPRGLVPDPALRWRNRAGCASCRGGTGTEAGPQARAGYRRQIAVAETIRPDPAGDYMGCVRAGDAFAARRFWLGEMGGVTVQARIAALVARGLVDARDAEARGVDFAGDAAAGGHPGGTAAPGTPRPDPDGEVC